MQLKATLTFIVCLFSSSGFAQESKTQDKMTQKILHGLIAAVSEVEEQQDNYLQFRYNDVRMALISDTNADRMRLITPIVKVDEMDPQEVYIVLESNYHLALDARYATSNGVLYSVYIHPLSPLDENQVMSALRQVSTLAQTYGSHYTSGELNFGQGFNQSSEDVPAEKSTDSNL